MIPPDAIITRAAVREVHASTWEEVLQEAVRLGTLHPQEAELALSLPESRRATFVAGREAMRVGLSQLGPGWPDPRATAILRTTRGAPALPDTVAGSITHKRTLAMATVAPRTAGLQYVGLDLERRPTERDLAAPSIARRILTAREYDDIQQWGDQTLEGRERVLLHFAIKEAVYKAIDPFVGRYVRFTEVELAGLDSGAVAVTLHLPEAAVAEVRVTAGWRVEEEWMVAWAASY